MQDKESRYPKDWLRKTDSDLKAAEVLFKAQNLEAAAFHIQQAIEKCLKGYLLSCVMCHAPKGCKGGV